MVSSTTEPDRRLPVVVIGAGIAGLTAASDLTRRGIPTQVFEASGEIAGLSKSFRDDEGFTYDFGAHFLTNRLAAALGITDSCEVVSRYGETVYINGKTYSFPFGLLRSPRFALSALASRIQRSPAAASAADYYRQEYGSRLSERVAIPLLEAWSGVQASDLAVSVIPPQAERGAWHVMKLRLASRLTGRAVANGYSREKAENPNVWHVYPSGGVAALCERLSIDLKDRILLQSRVEKILVEHDAVVGVRVNGRDVAASAVVSTAPVHILPKLIEGSRKLDYLTKFRYRPMTLVNMKFVGRPMLPHVVTWVPDNHIPFFRLTEVPQSVPWLAPPGMTMITADIGCEVGDEIWEADDETLGQKVLEGIDEMFPGARSRYRGCRVLRTPIGYPVYLSRYEDERKSMSAGLEIDGLYSIGRNGEFAHILMEDVYWRTLEKVRRLRSWLAEHE